MSLYPDYVTVDDLKRHLRVPGVFEGTINMTEDVVDDIPLAQAITTASRVIDVATNRQFGLAASASAMIYTAEYNKSLERYSVRVDDFMTTSGLIVAYDPSDTGSYSETVASTDYRVYPFNAATKGKPWTEIVFDSGTSITTGLGRVQVTAQWGWSSVPTAIKSATLVQATRFFKRKDSPYGIAGSPEMGNEMRLWNKIDPDVYVMVNPYRRWSGV